MHRGEESNRPEVSSPLDKWRRGLTHSVIIHLDFVEDHTAAPLDDFLSTAVFCMSLSQLVSLETRGLWMAHQKPRKGRATSLLNPFGWRRRRRKASQQKTTAPPEAIIDPLVTRSTMTTHPL